MRQKNLEPLTLNLTGKVKTLSKVHTTLKGIREGER